MRVNRKRMPVCLFVAAAQTDSPRVVLMVYTLGIQLLMREARIAGVYIALCAVLCVKGKGTPRV